MGSGYKPFTAASVLTSADMNNYLMEQSVMFFATTAARDAAITAPEDGMVAYIGSNDSDEGLYTYNGTSWRKGPGWNAPWGVMGYLRLTTSKATTAPHTTFQTTDLTLTFNAVNRRILRVTSSHGHYANGGANGLAINHFVNGAGASGGGKITLNTSLSETFVFQSVHTTTATASITIAAFHAASPTNTAITDFANSANPRWIMVEDVGPSGAPA
jgi:hypothetical protein